jgi:hypothetical protein
MRSAVQSPAEPLHYRRGTVHTKAISKITRRIYKKSLTIFKKVIPTFLQKIPEIFGSQNKYFKYGT